MSMPVSCVQLLGIQLVRQLEDDKVHASYIDGRWPLAASSTPTQAQEASAAAEAAASCQLHATRGHAAGLCLLVPCEQLLHNAHVPNAPASCWADAGRTQRQQACA